MKNCIIIALLAAGLVACKKEKTNAPAASFPQTITPVIPVTPNPASARVIGQVIPLAVAKMTALRLISQKDGQAYTVNADAGGILNLNLPPGPYQVELYRIDNPAIVRLAPLTINSGQTKDLNILNFGADGNSFTINGTAVITGTISPANAGSMAYAINRQTFYQYKGTIDANGKFEIKDLPDGTYDVGVGVNTNFTPVAADQQPVTVAIGQTAAAGTYLFNDNTLADSPNYLVYELDGIKKYRDNFYKAYYSEPGFGLYSYTMATVDILGLDIRRSIIADRLDLTLDQVKGVGTYQLRGSGAFIRITHQEIKSSSSSPYSMSNKRIAGALSIWSTAANGGSGTITITAINPVNKTISGTFSCTAGPENSAATGQRSITRGEFKNYQYQETAF